jgi:hypothetical protein
MKGRCK